VVWGGADGFALAAAFALVPVKQHLGLRALTFRIVAPGAAQIAAFEKYRGSNSRPIHIGIALNVENHTLIHRNSLLKPLPAIPEKGR